MMKNEKNVNKNVTVIAVIIALLIGSGGMYAALYFGLPITSSTIINKSEKEVTITDTGIADAVEKLYDSVVVVSVYKDEKLAASGTGFVYKKNETKAYILTNSHVVNMSGNIKVKVKFTDGREEEVKIEGNDTYSDLAVLSLSADKVEFVASIGSSEKTRLGDTVFTIGAPLDTEYSWSITRGVLSGKDRMVEVTLSSSSQSDYVMKVLQTDASINSGNSGGPLANANGEVIGITNMKLVSNGIEGMGFAIPIDDAIEFAETIIRGESIKRPLLGVSMINLSDTWALYQKRVAVKTELTDGVVVAEIKKGSPADTAGLKKGDIITALGDDKVLNLAQLRYYLFKHKVGDTVTITFERDGTVQKLKVILNATNE